MNENETEKKSENTLEKLIFTYMTENNLAIDEYISENKFSLNDFFENVLEFDLINEKDFKKVMLQLT